MRRSVVVAVVAILAVVLVILNLTHREPIPIPGATAIAKMFDNFVVSGAVDSKVAKTLTTAFKQAEAAGDVPKMQKILDDATSAAKVSNAESTAHLKNLRNYIDELNGGRAVQPAGAIAYTTPGKVARGIELIKSKIGQTAIQKQLKVTSNQILQTAGDADTVKKFKDLSQTKTALDDATDREWKQFLLKIDVRQLSILSATVKNPDMLKEVNTKFSTRMLNMDSARAANSIRQPPQSLVRSFREAQGEVGRVADEGVPDSIDEIARLNATANVVNPESEFAKVMKKYEKWGIALSVVGVAGGVIGTVVSLLVKPPYWNDPGVQAGTGGATPGQQPAVNFINWLNENPAAFTMSSCMSCLCCCCCCVVLILALAGGGKKGGNNVSF